jgi:hypothetical protein
MGEVVSVRKLAAPRVKLLVGSRLVSTDRVVDMQRFSFVQENRPEEYVLHVLCAWHLVDGGFLATGSEDVEQPAQEIDPASPFDWDRFDWKPPGTNQRDRTLERVLGRRPQGLVVRRVSVDAIGGLRLGFPGRTRLQLFPARTKSYYDVAEHWRLIHVDTTEPHLVVTAQGAYEI